MVSQPSLGSAKWASPTWKYLLGTDSLCSLFFQWVFCCNIQGSDWARSFSRGRAEPHSQLVSNSEGKAALAIISYSCTHNTTEKNKFLQKTKFTLKHHEKLQQDCLCPCVPSLLDTHAAPDPLSCKHTESVTCENGPDLSNMSSALPAPHQIERSFM